MNAWSASSPTPESSAPSTETDFELSRFADAVTTERTSLLVVRPTAEALNSLADSLQSLWQARAPGLPIEHFSGRHSAGLLGHLNATLAERPLELAMQENAQTPLQRLCLVKDAEYLSADELLLLQRMIASFPGWPICLVLLFKVTLDTSEKLHNLLNQPSKGLMVWQWHKPMAAEAMTRPTASSKRWTVVLGSLMVLGAAVLWQRSANNGDTHDNTHDTAVHKAAVTPPAAQASEARLLASAPVSGSSDNVETAAQANPAAAPTESAASASAATPTPTPTPMPSPSHAASLAADGTGVAAGHLPPGTPKAPAVAEKAPQPATTPPVPEVAARGQRWLASLPKDVYLIGHGTHESLRLALRQMESRSELNNARVIMLKPTATAPSRFMVVTGPFRSQERAQNFSVRQKLPASAVILQAGDILRQSQKSTGTKSD